MVTEVGRWLPLRSVGIDQKGTQRNFLDDGNALCFVFDGRYVGVCNYKNPLNCALNMRALGRVSLIPQQKNQIKRGKESSSAKCC